MDLLKIRDELDVIDQQITRLFEERMRLCGEVAAFKLETGKAVFDPVREQQKIEKIGTLVEDEFNRMAMQEILTQMMAVSRRRQYQIMVEKGKVAPLELTPVKKLPTKGKKAAYCGVEGAYAYEATVRFFGEDMDKLPVASFNAAMTAIENGEADYAVLPIENSTAGAVGNVYDLLAEHTNIIVGEIDVPICHCLLGVPGSTLEDITEVQSHPQALSQCRHYLDEHPEWVQLSSTNTALSAKVVAEKGNKHQAAIASEAAGKLYGLEVLEKGINHQSENTTRFVVVTGQKIYQEDAGKIRICFECPHIKGSLHQLLAHFKYNDLNMTRIESRLIPEKNWEYRFFVDFEGNLNSGEVRNALLGLESEATVLRILGTC